MDLSCWPVVTAPHPAGEYLSRHIPGVAQSGDLSRVL